MAAMKGAGYDVNPLSKQEIIEKAQALLSGYYDPKKLDDLREQGLAINFPVAQYKAWLNSLPEHISMDVIRKWGQPEEHWSVRDIEGKAHFVMPVFRTGKLLMIPQPPRADKLGESVHDLKQPPGHLYLATYLYLREGFKSHEIIHLGTHGTQEWTPGKDRGLWAYDYPFLTVGNVPVFYPYIQDNIAEAIQAKRRGRAVIISHQTPAFAPSGFYDELRDIHDLMHEYEQLDEGVVRDETMKRMMKKSIEANMHKDLGWQEDKLRKGFKPFIPALHDHLHELAQSVTPLGLHTFGKAALLEHRITTVMQQLGEDYYKAMGFDLKEMFAQDFKELNKDKTYLFLKRYIEDNSKLEEIKNLELRKLIKKAIDHERHLAETHEIESLLKGLDGGFIIAGAGGDPVRNPKTTSGTNLYAFEPNKVPTKAAYEAGGGAFKQLIATYQQDHDGAYPDKLAFSLWSSETIRTLGIMEGQILQALGVRPIWDEGGRVTKFEIIPISELGRPRVDTVLQITSVYRDQFDGLILRLAAVIEELSKYEEEDNIIALNTQKTLQHLLSRGVKEAQAKRFANIRLFSNPPGDYGSGVTGKAMDSTSWEDDKAISDVYFNSQSHAYGTKDWGTPVGEGKLFQSQLKGVDAAILSRSSNLHGLLSTDHPFEYLGGLSMASKVVNGKNPDLYIADFRKKKSVMTKASKFLSSELKTRYQNPQWIGAMKEEGYAGTVQMLKIVNNMFGWQVMDETMIRADQWQSMHETYVMDKRNMDLNEWFVEHNATAQAQIIERMAEAIRKGYWNAEETTKRELVERWQELTDHLGADKGKQKTVEFLNDMASGFGLNIAGQGQVADSSPDPSLDKTMLDSQNKPQKVRGQVMEQVSSDSPDQPSDKMQWLIWTFLLLIICAGMMKHYGRQKQFPLLSGVK